MVLEFLENYRVEFPTLWLIESSVGSQVCSALKLNVDTADKMADNVVSAIRCIAEEGKPIDLHMVEMDMQHKSGNSLSSTDWCLTTVHATLTCLLTSETCISSPATFPWSTRRQKSQLASSTVPPRSVRSSSTAKTNSPWTRSRRSSSSNAEYARKESPLP